MKTRMGNVMLGAMVCVMAVMNFASADTIRGINIDFVTIGNAGNAADGTTGYGAVGYDYRIGKYEITNAQWNTFTVAAGAPTGNPSNAYDQGAYFIGAEQPTGSVSWYEALQFCNYLTSGDKSRGVYEFSGNNANPGDFLGINRAAAQATYGTIYFLPNEDEWYKAAYYKPDGSGYSLYANGTNTAPIPAVESNYDNAIGTPWDVGFGTQEQNGTFDMMGNFWEWNETLWNSLDRVERSGAYNDIVGDLTLRHHGPPYNEDGSLGFRVASVPEPPELAAIDIDPDTLNLGSKEKWVTCYIELPDGYDVMDIDGSTVMLDGIPAYIGTEGWARAGANTGNIMDHDGDGILERMVKFDGAAVRSYLIGLGLSGNVGLTVTGDLVDGPSFEGVDVIRVIE